MSGDQSRLLWRRQSPGRCSPGVRGSVEDGSRRLRHDPVLPGCPGISREAKRRSGQIGRAPRVSGDQSNTGMGGVPVAKCSPGVRGSVGAAACGHAGDDVLPGCPGISRSRSSWPRSPPSAPRVSGDQSTGIQRRLRTLLCSPGVRGSVAPPHGSGRPARVLPGCPGISRPRLGRYLVDAGAPRVSGDQSNQTRQQRPYDSCSPGVRGSVGVSVCQCVSVSVCQCVSVSVCQCVSVSVRRFEGAPRVSGDQS